MASSRTSIFANFVRWMEWNMADTKNSKTRSKKGATAKKSAAKEIAPKTQAPPTRLSVAKTFKMYVNGAFIRSERGRCLPQHDQEGNFVANYSWASRKDFRDAMVAARKAQGGWGKRSAFNRSQILFRIAEMLESRRGVFVENLVHLAGYSADEANAEVDAAVDRIFWYAGWCDKYIQVLGSVNPIAAPFFNFSFPEPTGVVTVFAPKHAPLLGLVSSILPVIVSGNVCIAIVENRAPLVALELGEVFATSDVPGGVVNILTGKKDELIDHVANHMDLNAIAYFGDDAEVIKTIQEAAAENVKRVTIYDDPADADWQDPSMQSLYRITPFIEMKTAWHPMGQ